MAGRTALPASDVDHRGIHHWRLGVGAAIQRLVRTNRSGSTGLSVGYGPEGYPSPPSSVWSRSVSAVSWAITDSSSHSGHRRRGGPRTGGRSRGPVPPSLPRPSWPVRCGGSPPSAHRAPDCLRRTTPTGTGGHPRLLVDVGHLLPELVGRRQVVGRDGARASG